MGCLIKYLCRSLISILRRSARLLKFHEPIEGSKITVLKKGKGNRDKRKINGTYPKWQLMASHVCRRSFCTNLYGILPTPLIMRISAHSSEKMLLNYIGKDSLDFCSTDCRISMLYKP